MISPSRLYDFLQQKEVRFYTGVPDSLLRHFLKYLHDHTTTSDHIITANEGLAIALASGYHFGTGKLPLVYLQNSGLGNIINPVTSLADKEMYSVPMLLMIGWRGRPGTKDEPQHKKMGRITTPLLDVLEIPWYLLDGDEASVMEKISYAIDQSLREQKPVAVLVPEDIFETYEGRPEASLYTLNREEVIGSIVNRLTGEETIICTTGKSGREFYELNKSAGGKLPAYLLSAGAMGHANHIALGIKNILNTKLLVIDGDGAVLMHMGALPTLAHHAGNGFIHIVINNGCHESVGGQPTEGFFSDLSGIARACGYPSTVLVTNQDELEQWLSTGLPSDKLQFVEIRTANTSRPDLGRPAGAPVEWKMDFMKAITLKK